MASIRKTEQAKQLLVRYIRDHGLSRGDRLPTMDQMRLSFNVGTATISAAISELKRDGVLDVKDKKGVFVIDPNADGHAGRLIGIAARFVETSPYYSCLLCSLQMRLIQEGCRVHIFRLENKKHLSHFSPEIGDYPGLGRFIENDELDGLIHLDDFSEKSLRFIEKRKLPLLFVGAEGVSPNGLFLDQKRALPDIFEKLKKFRPQRPAVFCPGGIDRYLKPLFMELAGPRGRVYTGRTLADGHKVAEQIVRLRPEARPDWIIYLDDIIAQKITSELALALPREDLPRAVVVRNKQLMISYPLVDPIFYEIDLVEFSEKAVSLLTQAMKSGDPAMGRHYQRIQESPQGDVP